MTGAVPEKGGPGGTWPVPPRELPRGRSRRAEASGITAMTCGFDRPRDDVRQDPGCDLERDPGCVGTRIPDTVPDRILCDRDRHRAACAGTR